jgi:Uncharacterized Fe-S protein
MAMNTTIQIRDEIKDVFSKLETNNFATLGMPDEPMWEEPLVGIAAGDDEYYEFFKTHIGSFHMTPKELFLTKYGDDEKNAERDINASDLRVISMAFPHVEQTVREQNTKFLFPCDRWVVARGEWEPLMQEFSGNLVSSLESQGIRAVSLDLFPSFHLETSENLGIASVWSHRHTAFVAGLGTFGLSEGFITEKGKAIRLTSMVVEMPLEVTSRTYKDQYEWCKFFSTGRCGACIKSCPADAITTSGHDKNKCSAYEDVAIAKYWPKHIERGDYMFGCGICQAGMPCSRSKPKEE